MLYNYLLCCNVEAVAKHQIIHAQLSFLTMQIETAPSAVGNDFAFSTQLVQGNYFFE